MSGQTITRPPHLNRCEVCFPETRMTYCPHCGRDDFEGAELRVMQGIAFLKRPDVWLFALIVALAWWLG